MKGLEKVLKYAAICLICLMCLIPFYVLLVLALNSCLLYTSQFRDSSILGNYPDVIGEG